MSKREIVHLDSEMVKALAHPLRMRLIALLRSEGPATATGLAKKMDTNSGATSYHLRRLAEVGFVRELPEMGNKRQRYWEAAQHGMSWRDTEYDDDPDARAASDFLTRHLHRQYGRWVDDWLDARSEWPDEWRDVADQSDYSVTVTPDQLAEMTRRVREIYEEYDRDDAGEEAEDVLIITYAFPARAVRL